MAMKAEQVHLEEDLARFLKNFPDPLPLELQYFRPVQWPIVVAEARVRIRSVQDYGVLSLLILRLFDAGITSEEAICSISGMSAETVHSYVDKEMYLLEHIDPETGKLTDLGRETLRLNGESTQKPQSCQMFDSAVRIHVEPVTASLVPQYLEWELLKNIQPEASEGDYVLPPADVLTDEDFLYQLNGRLVEELNGRKDEHVQADALKNGDVIDNITDIRPLRLFFRWAYLAKFAGMRYPMLLLSGKLSAENTNAHTKAAGVRRETVIRPVNLAQTDKEFLEELGMLPENALARPDACFEGLEEEFDRLTFEEEAEEDEE